MSSQLEWKKANLVVLRLHADNLSIGAGEFADGAYVIAGKDRRSVADMGSFLADVRIVPVGKEIVAGGVHAACHHRGPARENEHDIFPEFRQRTLVSRTEALPQANQQQQRSHTPGNSKHG